MWKSSRTIPMTKGVPGTWSRAALMWRVSPTFVGVERVHWKRSLSGAGGAARLRSAAAYQDDDANGHSVSPCGGLALHASGLSHSSTTASPAQRQVARGRCPPRRSEHWTCRRGGCQRVAAVGAVRTTSLSTTPASGRTHEASRTTTYVLMALRRSACQTV